MSKDTFCGLKHDARTGNANAPDYVFKTSEVIGLTMSPDGIAFANLKDFRQARIRVVDYMTIKEMKTNKSSS